MIRLDREGNIVESFFSKIIRKKKFIFASIGIIILVGAIISFFVFIFIHICRENDIKEFIEMIVTVTIALATGGTYIIIFYFRSDFNKKFPTPPDDLNKSFKNSPIDPPNSPLNLKLLEIDLKENKDIINLIENKNIECFYFQNLSDDLEILALEEKLTNIRDYIENREKKERIIKIKKMIEKEQFFSVPSIYKILYFRSTLKDCFSCIVDETTNKLIIEKIGYKYLKNIINL